MEEACLATGDLAVPARPATKKLSGRKLAMRIMLGALGASVPQEDVVLPKAVRKATAAVVAQSGDSSKSDGAVFSALLADHVWKRRKAL